MASAANTNESTQTDPGMATVELFGPDEINELRAAFDALGLEEDHRWYVSSRDRVEHRGLRADQRVKEIARRRVAEVFPDHRILFAAFCSKGRRSDEPVWFHQDVTFVDERHHRSLLVWTPLVDCDDQSGVLQAVPGSHRWSARIRPSFGPEHQPPTADLHDELAALAPAVALPAGTALAIDAATVHGSRPNRTDRLRPAVSLALVPRAAQVVHFHLDANGALSGHAVDDDFFTTQDLTQRPAGFAAVEPWAPAVDADELRSGALAAARSTPR